VKPTLRKRHWLSSLAVIAVVFAASSATGNHYILDCPDRCLATQFVLEYPGAVIADAHGNVYFSSPNVVFRLDGDGMLTRVAGDGSAGYSGDGGPAAQALLSFPKVYPELQADPFDFSELVAGLATDAAGNLYIADAYNNRVRKVDLDGIITTVAGDGGKLNFGDDASDGKQATKAQITWPQGVVLDSAGNLYVTSVYGTLRKVTPDGVISTLVRPNCGPGNTGPGLCMPEQIAIAVNGNIYVPDGYCRVRMVSPSGTDNTVVGHYGINGGGFGYVCGYSGDGGPADLAALSWPYAVAVDGAGDLLIADTYNHCIRKVDGSGTINTVAGICQSKGFSGDGGPAVSAQLNLPHGVAVDPKGNIFIADSENNRIRKVSPDGIITTVAGTSLVLPKDVRSEQPQGYGR
jgi:hypothetical protein